MITADLRWSARRPPAEVQCIDRRLYAITLRESGTLALRSWGRSVSPQPHPPWLRCPTMAADSRMMPDPARSDPAQYKRSQQSRHPDRGTRSGRSATLNRLGGAPGGGRRLLVPSRSKRLVSRVDNPLAVVGDCLKDVADGLAPTCGRSPGTARSTRRPPSAARHHPSPRSPAPFCARSASDCAAVRLRTNAWSLLFSLIQVRPHCAESRSLVRSMSVVPGSRGCQGDRRQEMPPEGNRFLASLVAEAQRRLPLPQQPGRLG
jgi:hypothetical protein